MKTLTIASIVLIGASGNPVYSWEEAWQNPDLGTGVYDKPVTFVEETKYSSHFAVSLDTFNEGNPEHVPHIQFVYPYSGIQQGLISSLDVFTEGNDDYF